MDQALAVLSPMWQRIARGEVDLSNYTDEEILSGKIMMDDGRLLPQPKVFPDTFQREQIKRGFRKAQRLIREGAMDALDVYQEILVDDTLEPRDRMRAAEFFTTRFLGKPDQHVVHHEGDATDAREALIQRLLKARSGLPAATVVQLAQGHKPEDVEEIYEAEVVDDATLALEDLL